MTTHDAMLEEIRILQRENDEAHAKALESTRRLYEAQLHTMEMEGRAHVPAAEWLRAWCDGDMAECDRIRAAFPDYHVVVFKPMTDKERASALVEESRRVPEDTRAPGLALVDCGSCGETIPAHECDPARYMASILRDDGPSPEETAPRDLTAEAESLMHGSR